MVEDDDDVRKSLAVLLNGSEGFECVSTHRSAEDALAVIPGHRPDVVLMDIHLPGQSGIECVRQLKARLPACISWMASMSLVGAVRLSR